jgi:hypothetical protein
MIGISPPRGYIRLQRIEIGWFEQKRVPQQHRRPQVISPVPPGRIPLLKSDPFMGLAAKGAVNSCAELDLLFFGCRMCGHRLVNVYCRESKRWLFHADLGRRQLKWCNSSENPGAVRAGVFVAIAARSAPVGNFKIAQTGARSIPSLLFWADQGVAVCHTPLLNPSPVVSPGALSFFQV